MSNCLNHSDPGPESSILLNDNCSVFYSSPCTFFAGVLHLEIFMPLGIYTPNVIILSLLSGLSILQPFTLLSFFVSSLSFLLLSYCLSVAHCVQCCRCFQEDMSGVQGNETKEDADIYILCLFGKRILACFLLMQFCSMPMVPGGAGHV